MFLNNDVLPQVALATSKVQKMFGILKDKYITDANRITTETLRLNPVIIFLKKSLYPTLEWFENTMPHTVVGMSFLLTNRDNLWLFRRKNGRTQHLLQPLSCSSYKQYRVSYSSFSVENWKMDDAEYRVLDPKMSYDSMVVGIRILNENFDDSRGLPDTITTFHELREYHPKKLLIRRATLMKPDI